MIPEPRESTAKRRQSLARMRREEAEMEGQMDFFGFGSGFGKVLLAGVGGSLSALPSLESRPSASMVSSSSASCLDGLGGSGSQAGLSIRERSSLRIPRHA